jgi:beta-xylosidase
LHHLQPELKLQRAGHASLVETQQASGICHISAEDLFIREQMHYGKRTAIQKMKWTDDVGSMEVAVKSLRMKFSTDLPIHNGRADPVLMNSIWNA